MHKSGKTFYKQYRLIVNSIAFYPVIIASVFFVLALVMMALEYHHLTKSFKENLSFLLVNSREDARLILGTLVASIISLMVFSFSMVMLVLNRATATLSPRVIPGLITDKSNQLVLGFYLGSIVYSLILIINIQSNEVQDGIPALGILIAMICGIGCLSFFVYFIHTISQSIQVDNILDRILNSTIDQMDKRTEPSSGSEENKPETRDWFVLKTQKAGYLKRVNVTGLKKLCKERGMVLQLIHPIGFFHVSGMDYLRVSKEIDHDCASTIHELFVFFPEEHLEDHYIFGINQISEISVKALSPGINDPGTAIKGIDMLSILFIKKMSLPQVEVLKDDDEKVCLFFAEIILEDLLYDTLTPIREYGKKDAIVMYNLLESMKNMILANSDKSCYDTLITYTESILETCKHTLHNGLDLDKVNSMVALINELTPDKYELKKLKNQG